MEAKGRDADDGDNKKNTSRAMKMMFQMDAQEMDEKLREDVSVTRGVRVNGTSPEAHFFGFLAAPAKLCAHTRG